MQCGKEYVIEIYLEIQVIDVMENGKKTLTIFSYTLCFVTVVFQKKNIINCLISEFNSITEIIIHFLFSFYVNLLKHEGST